MWRVACERLLFNVSHDQGFPSPPLLPMHQRLAPPLLSRLCVPNSAVDGHAKSHVRALIAPGASGLLTEWEEPLGISVALPPRCGVSGIMLMRL